MVIVLFPGRLWILACLPTRSVVHRLRSSIRWRGNVEIGGASTAIPSSKPVVAGIDGSESALGALRWAAAEAVRRGTWLEVVCCDVLAGANPAVSPSMPVSQNYIEALQRQTRVRLERARHEAHAAAPDLEMSVHVRVGNAAASILIEESRSAQLTVVGSRGLGGFTRLLVGSVAKALCAHGRCPVVIVRNPSLDHRSDAPVVVGVDTEYVHELTLEAAFDAATRRRCRLVAVHAWFKPVPEEVWYRARSENYEAAVQRNEERLLSESLAGWVEKYPHVEVRHVVMRSQPTRALLENAAHARLLVVGARARGGFSGLLLGSTSQQMVHHAPGPLLVVR